MTTGDTLSTYDGDQSDEIVSLVQCDCGNWLKAEAQRQRVSCECGRVFAVTITNIPVNSSQDTD